MSDKVHNFKELTPGVYEDRTVQTYTSGESSVFVHDFLDGAKYFHYKDLWLTRAQAYDLCGAFYCGLFSDESDQDYEEDKQAIAEVFNE